MHCTGVQAQDDQRWGTGWHGGPHSYKQLTGGQLKCRTIFGQNHFIRNKKKEQVYNVCKRYYKHSEVPYKFTYITEMQTNGEQAKYKSTLANLSEKEAINITFLQEKGSRA